jgi:hypothetical protein
MNMETLTIGKDLLVLLRQARGPAELRDENGAFVGVFSPDKVPTSGEARRKVRTPAEEAALLAELDRRTNDPRPDRTFRQAFERLLTLATDPTQRNLIQEKIDQLEE